MKKYLLFLLLNLFLFTACTNIFENKKDTKLKQFVNDYIDYSESNNDLQIENGLYFLKNGKYQFYSLDLLKSSTQNELENLEEKINNLNYYACLAISEKTLLLSKYESKENFTNSSISYEKIINRYSTVYNVLNDNFQFLDGSKLEELNAGSIDNSISNEESQWYFFEADSSYTYHIYLSDCFDYTSIYDENMNLIDKMYSSSDYYDYSSLEYSKIYIEVKRDDSSNIWVCKDDSSSDYSIYCTKELDTDYSPIDLYTEIRGSISENFQINAYSLNLEKDQDYLFSTSLSDDFDCYISIYDADHNLIKRRDSSFSFTANSSTIYLEIEGDYFYDLGTYSFSISEYNPSSVDLNYGEWTEGVNNYNYESCWYHFEGESNSKYLISFSDIDTNLYGSPNSDSSLRVYYNGISQDISNSPYLYFTNDSAATIDIEVQGKEGTYYLKYENAEYFDEADLESSNWHEGNIESSSQINWYYFNVIKGERYAFLFSSLENPNYGSPTAGPDIDIFHSDKDHSFIYNPKSVENFVAENTEKIAIRVQYKSNYGNYFIKMEPYNGPYKEKIKLSDSFLGEFIFSGEEKLYSFEAVEGQNYIISYRDSETSEYFRSFANIEIEVYNKDMTELLVSTSDNKLMTFTAPSSEEINIKVHLYDDQHLGYFSLSCNTYNGFEINDLNADIWSTGEFKYIYEEIWYSFRVESGKTYKIYLSDFITDTYSHPNVDASFEVYNEEKNEILSSNDDEEYITYSSTYTGTIYIKAQAYNPKRIGNFYIKYEVID